MNVFKFGGSILNNSNDIDALCNIVASAQNHELVIVVSALGSSTRSFDAASLQARDGDFSGAVRAVESLREYIIALADSVLRSATSRQRFHAEDLRLFEIACSLLRGISITRQRTVRSGNAIRALGEDYARFLIAEVLFERGIANESIDARSVIRTKAGRHEAAPDMYATASLVDTTIRPLLRAGRPLILQGYVASDAEGITTTMGKESSNLTAAVIANILGAEAVTVFTNVDGVMSVDPLMCESARTIPILSYYEAHILALQGVKVLYPTMIPMLESRSIPLHIRSLHSAGSASTGGTTISRIDSSSSLRCIVHHDRTRLEVHQPLSLTRQPYSSFSDSEESLVHVRTATFGVDVVADDTSDAPTDSPLPHSLLSVFHDGLPCSTLMRTTIEICGNIEELGFWSVGPHLSCIRIPTPLLRATASRLHDFLVS
jgi:aspartate kinase